MGHSSALTAELERTFNSRPTPNLLKAIPEEHLKAFMDAVKADAGLQKLPKTAGDTDSVVASTKAADFIVSSEELKKSAKAGLTDEEQDQMTGRRSRIDEQI